MAFLNTTRPLLTLKCSVICVYVIVYGSDRFVRPLLRHEKKEGKQVLLAITQVFIYHLYLRRTTLPKKKIVNKSFFRSPTARERRQVLPWRPLHRLRLLRQVAPALGWKDWKIFGRLSRTRTGTYQLTTQLWINRIAIYRMIGTCTICKGKIKYYLTLSGVRAIVTKWYIGSETGRSKMVKKK